MIGDERLRTHAALGDVAAERLAARAQILDFDAVFGGAIKGHFDAVLVVQGNAETRAKFLELFLVQLFLLMGDVLAFAGFAEAVTFNSARENNSRTALVFDGSFVGGVDFARIVAAEAQAAQRLVGKRLDELQQARVAAKEMLAHVGAGFDDELLVFAVD